MRSGLFKKVVFPDQLTNQLVTNVGDAIATLTADDDILRVPVTALQAAAPVPAGKSVVFYRGAPGAALQLPSAAAQGSATAAIILLGNLATGAVTVRTAAGDTINGSASLSVAAGALVTLVSDGANVWLAK